MTKHTVSAAATGLPVEPIDQIDGALDLLRTSWLALNAPGWLDDDAIMSVSATLDRAISDLAPVRKILKEAGTDLSDVDLYRAWDGYCREYRALVNAPDEPEHHEVIYAKMTPHEDILENQSAKTLGGLLLKVKFWFLKMNANTSGVMAMIEDSDIPEADRSGWPDSLGWNVVQNLRELAELEGLSVPAAKSVAPPTADQSDPFTPLLARYLIHWDACPNETRGEAAELAWNDETTRLEAKLCEVMPTTKAGAIEAIRFVASRSPGQRCEVLDCQHALLTAAVDILTA